MGLDTPLNNARALLKFGGGAAELFDYGPPAGEATSEPVTVTVQILDTPHVIPRRGCGFEASRIRQSTDREVFGVGG